MIFSLGLFHHHGIDADAPEDIFVDKRKIVKASHTAYKSNDAEKWQFVFPGSRNLPGQIEQGCDRHDQGIGEKEEHGQTPLQGSEQDGHTSGHIAGGYSKQARYLLIARLVCQQGNTSNHCRLNLARL